MILRVVLDTNQFVSALLNPLKKIAHIDESQSRERIVFENPDDDKFFHLAIKTGAQYIVSRDIHLLNVKEFRGVRVLKPEVFLSALKRKTL